MDTDGNRCCDPSMKDDQGPGILTYFKILERMRELLPVLTQIQNIPNMRNSSAQLRSTDTL